MSCGTARLIVLSLAGALGIALVSACGRANRQSGRKEDPSISCVVRIDCDNGSVTRTASSL